MLQLGPAEANIEFEGGIPEPFAQVTVLPCGLVHIVPRFGGEFTIPAAAVVKIRWADERAHEARERQESAVLRDADSPLIVAINDATERLVDAIGEVELACERIRDPSMTG